MKQDMNDTFRIAFRAMVVAAMTLLSGGNAAAQDSGEGSGGSTTPPTTGVVVHGNVFGGGNLANVGGTVVVNMSAGTVDKDVYGGGALANTNTNNWNADGEGYELVSGLTAGTSVVTGLYTKSGESYTEITEANKTAEENTDYYKKVGAWAEGMYNTTTGATTNTTTVNLTGGTINGDAYGGGLGRIAESVHYTQEEADAYNSEHNLSSGNEGFKTTADWLPEVKATVYGDINVILGKDDASSATKFYISKYTDEQHSGVLKSGRVFGCNNLNGSPQGNVTVTVWKTTQGNTPRSETADKNNPNATYEVAAVYGGGNLANYAPTASGKKSHVIIYGCSDTSIEYVYGGGNAAAVPQSSVDVNAAYEIGYVFGGGNGKDNYTLDGSTWKTNPGANVNGNANTMLFGGTIHEAFGGSNEKGRITGTVSINSQNGDSESENYCALKLGKLYGAGKNADIDGDLIVVMGCMPGDEDPTTEVYGGAENANVKGDVELTITSGSFRKVFGGNNQSGAIFGHIKLNIEESGCTPIIIDELYLGGYNAPYSVYGYKNTGTADAPVYVARTNKEDGTAVFFDFNSHTKPNETSGQYDDPELNIISATRIGKVFGGGLGSGAIIYGNPIVNINQTYPFQFDATTKNYVQKTTSELGAIGVGYKDENNQDVEGGIFGGGNEAAVYGNTTVNIGNNTTVDWTVLDLDDSGQPKLDANERPISKSIPDVTVLGANIAGNVYGGGNLADVTGNTQVNICAKYDETTEKWESVSYGSGLAGVTIGLANVAETDRDKHGNVFGGGKGEADTFTCEKAMVGEDGKGTEVNYPNGNTHIIIGNGTVYGNVYGGGEIGRVEMNTSVTIGLGDGVASGGTVTSAPEIQHSVFGGGKGLETHGYSALVRGNPTVIIQGNAKVRDNVYGGGQIASVARYNVAKTDDEGAPYGVKKDEPYALKTNTSGFCSVTIRGNAEIGPETIASDVKTTTVGHVFGAGKGILPAFIQGTTKRMVAVRDDEGHITGSTWDDFTAGEADYITFVKTLALASQTNVTIDGNALVKGSVFGGSESGFVQFDTNVNVSGGTIGINGKGGADFGNVYGGGKGDVEYTGTDNNYVDAGIVKGNTKVIISETDATNHPTLIYHNVYGGGAYGTVGEFVYDASTGLPTGRKTYTVGTEVHSTIGGNTEIYITGGTIGTTGSENGMIFGSSRGDVGAPGSIHDKAAWVYDTHVAVGDTATNATITTATPLIKGSVYGGGENGHNLHNAYVRINGGTIGIASGEQIGTYSGAAYPYRGNVYGGGCGTDMYKYDSDNDGDVDDDDAEAYNPLAGIVQGNAIIHITAGNIVHNVYGAGAMGSVGTMTKDNDNHLVISSGGKTTVAISGGTVGVSGTVEDGNVFGAARGDVNAPIGLAQVKTTEVTISQDEGKTTRIYGNVYGGGALGDVGTYYTVTAAGNDKGNNDYLGGEESGVCTVAVTGGTIGSEGNTTAGHVFGAGKGDATTYTCQKAMVKATSVTISNGTIYGDVYGGGELGRVEQDAEVLIGSGAGDGTFAPIIHGNVFGAGAGLETHGYSALVRGNSTVTIEGDAKVRKNVYGGGKAATVGKYWVSKFSPHPSIAPPTGFPDGMPYMTRDGGLCTVTVQGNATIGPESGDATETSGQVFGACKGVAPNYIYSTSNRENNSKRMVTYDPTGNHKTGKGITWDPYGDDPDNPQFVWEYFTTKEDYFQFLESLALASNTVVTIGGSTGSTTVKASVFGGSESGFVQDHTSVTINNSAVIGTTTTTTYGNVFGGGKGLETFAEAGRVRGNTAVVFNGGRAYGNVYGGGELGDVGTIDKTDIKNYKWSGYDDEDTGNDTGVSSVTISGGSVGPDNNTNTEKGNVFGAGKGMGDTFWCEKAMVYDTNVSIENGTVNGNVYGGGEVGRVENDTEVTVGRKDGEAEGAGTGKPDIKGSVFGAGKGLETHGYSALVRGNTKVTVEGATGAKVGNSVYGGGEIASVGRYGLDDNEMPEVLVFGGRCIVNIQGSATIGSTTGNVFGAGKGVVPQFNNTGSDKTLMSRRMTLYTNATAFPADAMLPETGGTPAGTTPKGSTWEYIRTYSNEELNNSAISKYVWEYFQSEDTYNTYLETLALATHPEVTIDGSATVNGSVFGGGELGLTKGSVVVNIQGGTIKEDVYGGGSLADTNTTKDVAKRENGKPLPPDSNGKYDTEEVSPTTTVNLLGGKIVHDAYGGGLGDDTHAPKVKGDVLVELNNNNHGGTANGTQTGCVVDRIFGCNNLNGTPTKKVQVKVYATQKDGGENLLDKTTGSYDVRAVYGGGNLSPYEPDDALWEDPEDYAANKAKVDAARPEVTIDGCALTSIETVYGGGNAAPVPATYVVVERCYEINEVFGGGNGYDNYYKMEGGNQVWYQNPGANVGYYTYATYPKDEGHGTGVDEDHAYEAVEDPQYSENPGDEEEMQAHKTARLEAYDIQYGSGIATLVVKGGTVHTSYGGSNSKGNVRTLLSSTYSAMNTDCPMSVGQSYGGGKDAYSDADSDMRADCAKGVKEMFGGSKNADFNGNVNMLITNGSSLERVFGGNNTSGAVNGSIAITLEEGGCEPIIIKDLYLGGFLAPYSVYGYESDTEIVKDKNGNDIVDEDGNPIYQRKVKTSGTRLYDDPRIYVISATQIDNIYGGGYQAKLVGNPHINVNMTKGKVEVSKNEDGGTVTYTDLDGRTYTDIIEEGEGDAKKYYAPLPTGTIGYIYGGGNMADIIGDTHVEIGTGRWLKQGTNDVWETLGTDGKTYTYNETTKKWGYLVTTGEGESQTTERVEVTTIPTPARNAANITGSVYGGGNLADVTGNTYVDICAYRDDDVSTTDVIEYKGVPVSSTDNQGVTIKGDVFGGGKGITDSFFCDKAMVGEVNTNTGSVDITEESTDRGTRVSIGNGTIEGSVYGGGQVGRVEWNSVVTIGLPVANGTSAPEILGDVYGAGKGSEPFGYAALLRGNTFVTVQENAKVGHNVYGGGKIASVGKYNIVKAEDMTEAFKAEHPELEIGMPWSLGNSGSGYCNVTIRGNAEIGPDNMQMTKAGGPDDFGHVFGAGRGVLPYENKADFEECQTHSGQKHPGRMAPPEEGYPNGKWECYEGNEAKYLSFVETQALATQTEVTVGGNAFVKGSVYGGSMNGHVQHDTHVDIAGDCQIGAGFDESTGKSLAKYTDWPTETENIETSWKECAHWDYDKNDGAPYDPYAKYSKTVDGKVRYYYDEACKESAEGGYYIGKDGHTWYGNVFGGGSGVLPYAPGKWHRAAGSVGGNTKVDITGGHILTSAYGGNEQTDVGTYKKDDNGALVVPVRDGKCTINMTGGTIGVPRTEADMKAHPVTCYLFGAGKGDQRIFFNTWTNVISTEVNITGSARIYGSTFGGGEDGHVIGNSVTKIGDELTIDGETYNAEEGLIIGTTGTSYVDGNVFGGGRGFGGDAQTAGVVGGNIDINIKNGKMLGNIYGGGRLASVGTLFAQPEDPNYGNFVEDGGGKTYGHVTVNISGGTIGNGADNKDVKGSVSGNVFGGSMGRLTLLDGTTINPIWPRMAQVKSSTVTVSGGTVKHNVYGGGEIGTVRDNATVNINGGTVRRDVYGGGYGSEDYETKTKITVKEPDSNQPSGYKDQNYVFTPMIFAGCVGQNTFVNIAGGKVRKNVYGGGEMASVGIMDCRVEKDNDATDPVYTEGSDKYVYEHFHSHLDENNGFALSWPFHFENAPGYFGETHVNITGGRIGVANGDTDINTDNGDVYGGGKGIAGEYKNYVYCANVGSAEVSIEYPAGNTATPQNYMTNADIECIAGAVYGGAENGHVMGDTKLTLKNGLIGHSMYGGGSGKGTFTTTLNKITGVTVKTDKDPTSPVTRPTQMETTYDAEIYSITAGKVFGNTNVIMNGGYVVRNVYGGGNLGSVGKGNYAGGTDDYSYYNNGARSGYGETLDGSLWDKSSDPSKAFMNSGVSNVTINGGTVGYIDFNKVSDYTYSGLPYGNVFGGCRGESAPNIGESPRYLYSPAFFSGYVNETNVTIGDANSSEGPKIWGSVYGGGMDGHVRRDATVTINSGEIGRAYDGDGSADDLAKIEWSQCGNVYGAGSGIGQYNYDFNYDGDYEDVVEYTNPETGRASTVKERDFSTSAGSVTRFTKVEVKGGKIHRNVYGGGSLSSVGAPKIPPTREDDPIRRNDDDKTTQGLQSLNEVIISGSTTTIGDATSYDNNGNHVYGGFVFGASRGDETLSNPTSFASSVWTDVKVQGGTIYGDVYGGGEVGTVRQGTEVQLTGGVIGSVKGDKVVGGDVFGGGKGTSTVAADIGGDVLVELNKGVAEGGPGCVVDRIFGANNVNGTPKGHVTVHVYATQNRNLTAYPNIKAKKENVTSPEPPASDFDMTGVFGGGKSSDYVPTDDKKSTEVIIEGCSLTSIYEVYGGGFGASTPGTNVLINGTKIIDKVFGGGYGKSTTDIPNNPGANVGILSDGSTPYGLHLNDETKIAIVQLKAGKVNSVFGGSNSKGDIRNGASITTLTSDDAEEGTGDPDPCEILEVGELYGGGNEAPMEEGGAEVVLRCMPDSWIGEVYAGARKANVGNDVSLTITSGKFEQVFGGNKSDGKIDGYVEVNIEECPTCNTPVIIGELYGGGNEAEYTYPELDDDPNYPSPRVNVRAFTSIGTIYGGGKGADAVVTGNPTVYVSVGMVDGGGQDYSGETRTVDGKDIQLYGHEKGKIGVIGDIFGGGNAAEVNGNTNVFIGTEKYVKLDRIVPGETDVSNYYIRTGTSSNYEYTPVPRTKATAAGTYYQRNQTGTYTEVSVSAGDDVSGFYTRSGEGTEVSPFVYAPVSPAQSNTVYCLPVLGADIQGNVYGGGNAAKVTGHTNVVIGKKQE